MEPKHGGSEADFPFQEVVIFRFHVSFHECIQTFWGHLLLQQSEKLPFLKHLCNYVLTFTSKQTQPSIALGAALTGNKTRKASDCTERHKRSLCQQWQLTL